jgi:uncharacterized integral membrane protein
MEQERRVDRKQLYGGIALLAVGVIFLLHNLDYIFIGSVWRHWPLGLIAVGFGKLIDPKSDQAGGLVELLAGAVFYAINFKLFGLTYRNAWPLVIVFIGLSIVVKSLVERNANAARIGGSNENR